VPSGLTVAFVNCKGMMEALARRVAARFLLAELTVDKGIALIQKERSVRDDKGRNPCVSKYPGGGSRVMIHFFAPTERRPTEPRRYDWTGSSLKQQSDDPLTFATAHEAEAEIRQKVLSEIRRYHPGDDVWILGW
jgi:hypothetical protein